MKANSEIREIVEKIIHFRDQRSWEKFHDAKNLAICLNVEASELLEVFLWKENDEIDKNKLKEELADVFYSAFLLAEKFNLDVKEIVLEKLEENKKKYPINKSKGSNKKYYEL